MQLLGGDDFPKAILQRLKGEKVDPKMLQPDYGWTLAKNYYLMEKIGW